MTTDLKGRSFLTLADFTAEEITAVLEAAAELKRERAAGMRRETHVGKTLALLFQKPSLRTRVSFDVAMHELGGDALYLGPEEVGVGKRESIADVATVLSRYVHGVAARVFGHEIVESLVEYGTVPVINGLSDLLHPCQVLADLMTVHERFGKFEGLTLVYVGDGNNVANSLMLGGAVVGLNVTVVTPAGFEPPAEIISRARKLARRSGAKVAATNDLSAANGADVLYTDVWASMGQEDVAARKKEAFRGFTVDAEMLAAAAPHAIVLHCLPAHYGEEITEDVARGPQSAIWDEAENRLHAQKALLAMLL
ncbi:MAG: ornithine carbamoyltransferase [candidate division Zixibacteria bacterium]|nr:ornithine carbamoyltransferase [candidate division Zixibacteria bacterium]